MSVGLPPWAWTNFSTVHEHAARTAARVEDAALVRLDHLDQQLDDRLGRPELAAQLALSRRELAQEVEVDVPENVLRPAGVVAQSDGADQVDQLPEPGLVEVRAGVLLGQNTLENRVLLLDGLHRLVEQGADGRLLRLCLEAPLTCPAGLLRHPENAVGGILVAVLGIGPRLGEQLHPVFLEGVGDVLEENQSKHDILVLGGVHRATQLVGREPEFLLKAKGCTIIGRLLPGHCGYPKP